MKQFLGYSSIRVYAILISIIIGSFCKSSFAVIEPVFMNTGPKPSSAASSRQIVRKAPQSAVVLGGVPKSKWTYGCAATAAGMVFGYYDRNGYSDIYTGPRNGGVVPLRNLGNTTALIASKKGRDRNRSFGHVNDYWRAYGRSGPDPYETAGRAEHTPNCVADFLGTNQWKWDYNYSDGKIDFNVDGSTALWAYSSGEKLYDFIPSESAGLPQTSFCHGLKLYAEHCGYSVLENYTQRVDVDGGFSYLDYQSEIDAGRPVFIQLAGHSMVGVGYDPDSEIIYIHDTWDNRLHWMQWGESYAGMQHLAVTVLNLDSSSIGYLWNDSETLLNSLAIASPEPGSVSIILFGGLIILLRRRGSKD
ncbi:MAG: C39 family peptidase [Phycisphaerae bacterium]|jgi:hypothetical protein